MTGTIQSKKRSTTAGKVCKNQNKNEQTNERTDEPKKKKNRNIFANKLSECVRAECALLG